MENLIGRKFGIVEVIQLTGKIQGRYFWLIRCACGVEKNVADNNLRRMKSCGCQRDYKTIALKYPNKDKKTYECWRGIKKRCFQKSSKTFEYYGGRGITMCQEWKESFVAFQADMGNAPFENAQIDRINNNGNYCKENCRWVTQRANSLNTRRTLRIEYNGKKTTLSDAALEAGLPYKLVWKRWKQLGWTLERSLTEPIIGNGQFVHGDARFYAKRLSKTDAELQLA